MSEPGGWKRDCSNSLESVAIKRWCSLPGWHAVHRKVIEKQSFCVFPPAQGKLDPFDKHTWVLSTENQSDPGYPERCACWEMDGMESQNEKQRQEEIVG